MQPPSGTHDAICFRITWRPGWYSGTHEGCCWNAPWRIMTTSSHGVWLLPRRRTTTIGWPSAAMSSLLLEERTALTHSDWCMWPEPSALPVPAAGAQRRMALKHTPFGHGSANRRSQGGGFFISYRYIMQVSGETKTDTPVEVYLRRNRSGLLLYRISTAFFLDTLLFTH